MLISNPNVNIKIFLAKSAKIGVFDFFDLKMVKNMVSYDVIMEPHLVGFAQSCPEGNKAKNVCLYMYNKNQQ